ncbi:unnamed protein product, partial [Protopolystoma xenopodis]
MHSCPRCRSEKSATDGQADSQHSLASAEAILDGKHYSSPVIRRTPLDSRMPYDLLCASPAQSTTTGLITTASPVPLSDLKLSDFRIPASLPAHFSTKSFSTDACGGSVPVPRKALIPLLALHSLDNTSHDPLNDSGRGDDTGSLDGLCEGPSMEKPVSGTPMPLPHCEAFSGSMSDRP